MTYSRSSDAGKLPGASIEDLRDYSAAIDRLAYHKYQCCMESRHYQYVISLYYCIDYLLLSDSCINRTFYRMVLFSQAIRQFNMIQPGDRVLICLSGGKDSLSLLHCIRQYQCMQRNHVSAADESPGFDIGAVTVDPGTSSYDPSPLIPYMADLSVPYFYERQGEKISSIK